MCLENVRCFYHFGGYCKCSYYYGLWLIRNDVEGKTKDSPVSAPPTIMSISYNGNSLPPGAQSKTLSVSTDSHFSSHAQFPRNPFGTLFGTYPESCHRSPPPLLPLWSEPEASQWITANTALFSLLLSRLPLQSIFNTAARVMKH